MPQKGPKRVSPQERWWICRALHCAGCDPSPPSTPYRRLPHFLMRLGFLAEWRWMIWRAISRGGRLSIYLGANPFPQTKANNTTVRKRRRNNTRRLLMPLQWWRKNLDDRLGTCDVKTRGRGARKRSRHVEEKSLHRTVMMGNLFFH